METAVVTGPTFIHSQLIVHKINSLSIMEPSTTITSDLLLASDNNSVEQVISPRLFELTPLHETKYKQSFLSYSSNNQQVDQQFQTENIYTPSIENIVLQHQKNQEIRQFTQRCQLKVKTIFQPNRQYSSRQFETEQLNQQNQNLNIKDATIKQMYLSQQFSQSQVTPPTTPQYHQQKQTSFKSIDSNSDIESKTLEKTKKIQQRNAKLEQILQFLDQCNTPENLRLFLQKDSLYAKVFHQCLFHRVNHHP